MNALLLRSQLRVPQTFATSAAAARYYYIRMQSTATGTASALVASYDQSVDIFPSIVIGPNKSIVPQGPFAEAQAQVSSTSNVYFCVCVCAPDAAAVQECSVSQLSCSQQHHHIMHYHVQLNGPLFVLVP